MGRPVSLDDILSRELQDIQPAIRDDFGLAQDDATDNFGMDIGQLQANRRQERWQRGRRRRLLETDDLFGLEDEDWLWETDPLEEAARAAQLPPLETEEQSPEVEHIEYRDGEPSNSELLNDQPQAYLRQPNEDTPPNLSGNLSLDAAVQNHLNNGTSDSESPGNELTEPTPGVPESEPRSDSEPEPGSEPRQAEHGSPYPEPQPQEGNSGYNQL